MTKRRPGPHTFRRARTLHAALAVSGLVGAGLMQAATAEAATARPVVSVGSGLCLGVVGGRPAAGAAVELTDCDAGQDQQWARTKTGQLRTVERSLCLTATRGASGITLTVATCGDGKKQQFDRGAKRALVERRSKRCLAPAGEPVAGTRLTLATCTGKAPQRWAIGSPGSGPGNGSAIDVDLPVTREGAFGDNRFTVFRPTDPAAVKKPLPVVTYGNGGCWHGSPDRGDLLGGVASHGFVVIAVGSADGSPTGVPNGSPIPSLLTDAISWAEAENARSGSPLHHRLDLRKTATSGFSCGGLEALIAGQDPRVEAVVSISSGLFADGSFGYPRSELAKLHSPVMFMSGGTGDIAYQNSQDNYDLVTSLPSVLADHRLAGHGGLVSGNEAKDASVVMTHFLDYAFNGNPKSKAFLVNPDGLAAMPDWTRETRNL